MVNLKGYSINFQIILAIGIYFMVLFYLPANSLEVKVNV